MEIFDSPPDWILALGKTLVHSLWAGILFLSAVKLAFVFTAHRFALLRYRIASVMLLLFAGSMVVMFFYFFVPATEPGTVVKGTRFMHPVYHQISNGSDWLLICFSYSAYFYFAGIICYILYTASSIMRIRSIRKYGEPVPDLWLDRFMAMKEKTGTHQRVSLLESKRVDTPFLFGLIRPVIVVPAGLFTQLPFSQVEAILVHELFHLKRLDHLVNLFQRIVEILFFYNPAVWILSRIIRKEREICCDDMVLKVCQKPLDYARALYHLAMEQKPAPSLVPAATGNHRGQLFNRIHRILNQASMKTNIRQKLFAMMLLTGALLVVVVVSGFSAALSITRYNDEPSELSLPDPPQVVQPLVVAESERSDPPTLVVQPDTTIEPVQAVEDEDVFDEPDWEEIRKEMEKAKAEAREAMESIDWEEIRKEMEAARIEAMESINWEEIRKEMEVARIEAMESINWEEIRKEMEKAKAEAMEAMESVDWDEIQREIETVKIHLDTLLKEVENFPMKIEIQDRLEF